ncbi:MAG: 4'-phosphopantetheinyl transferase superfamily protein [Pseudomonadota bacterium]
MACAIWTGDPDRLLDGALADRCRTVLSADERARANRLVTPRNQREFILAHTIVRSALARTGGWDPVEIRFQVEPDGRPVVDPGWCPGRPLAFSISHTDGLVAVAVADAGRVGIDAEPRDRLATDPAGFAAAQFSPAEAVAVDRALALGGPGDAGRLAVQFWCLKEAFGKAVGRGLRLSPADTVFEVSQGHVRQFTLPLDGGDKPWRFSLFEPVSVAGRRHVVALATDGAVGPDVLGDGLALLEA